MTKTCRNVTSTSPLARPIPQLMTMQNERHEEGSMLGCRQTVADAFIIFSVLAFVAGAAAQRSVLFSAGAVLIAAGLLLKRSPQPADASLFHLPVPALPLQFGVPVALVIVASAHYLIG